MGVGSLCDCRLSRLADPFTTGVIGASLVAPVTGSGTASDAILHGSHDVTILEQEISDDRV
jgi:hypothetical protein